MPIDFPSGPTTGQVYTYQGKYWVYNGAAWDAVSYGDAQIPIEYLVIGGGAGGGERFSGYASGAGGAGGYRSNVVGQLSGGSTTAEPSLRLNVNASYAVIVGAGGVGGTFDGDAGTLGSRSVFHVITSQGGGTCRLNGTTDFSQGGSGGGGAGGSSQLGGKGITGEGTIGGTSIGGSTGGGGGGGAGAQGPTVTSGAGAAGGAGLSSTITGSSVFRGGGGGGGANSGSGGAGGAGGGGAGSLSTTATSGTVNTGGGGGGTAGGNGGAGGSGIVILRYPSQYTITIGAGLTGTTATVGATKVTTFTAGTGNVSWAF